MIKRCKCCLNDSGTLFYCSIIFSAVIHIAVLIEFPVEGVQKTSLAAHKNRFKLINFTLEEKVSSEELEEQIKNNSQIPYLKIEKKKSKKKNLLNERASVSKEAVRARETYEELVLKKIYRMKYYPYSARRLHREGEINLRFRLCRNGSLNDKVVILSECAYPVLNRAAVNTIQRANPFPPIPDKVRSDKITFTVSLKYELDRY